MSYDAFVQLLGTDTSVLLLKQKIYYLKTTTTHDSQERHYQELKGVPTEIYPEFFLRKTIFKKYFFKGIA